MPRAMPMNKRFQIGDKVTLKSGEREAYGSQYGKFKDADGNWKPFPKVVFKAGMVGTVATNDTAVVRGPEGAWFYCVDFHSETTGKKERVALYHKEIKQAPGSTSE